MVSARPLRRPRRLEVELGVVGEDLAPEIGVVLELLVDVVAILRLQLLDLLDPESLHGTFSVARPIREISDRAMQPG